MIKYCFDGYINNQACGWIANLKTPGSKFHIALVIGKEVHSVTEASVYRKDLEEAGIADGKFGFTIDLPSLIDSDCYLEVVELKKPIKESFLKVNVVDPASTMLFGAKDFSRYVQFAKARKAGFGKNNVKYSKRLSDFFGECENEHVGIPTPNHAMWAIQRHRRGGANFFTTPNESAWLDLAWYIFDYSSKDKSLYSFDKSHPLVKSFSSEPFNALSPLYMSWLLRTGQQVADVSSISDKQHCEYLGSLISAGVKISGYPELEGLKKLVAKRPRPTKLKALPRLSRYLKWKYEVGHTNNYNIEDEAGYIAFVFDVIIHANSFELEYLGQDIIDFFSSPVVLQNGQVTRFEFIVWLYSQRMESPKFSTSDEVDSEKVKEFYRLKWLGAHPQHDIFQSRDVSRLPNSEKSIYIVAHWDSGSGLTQNAIMSARAFAKSGLSVIKIYPSGERFYDLDAEPVEPRQDLALCKDLILLHVNADEAPEVLPAIGAQVNLDEAYIIGFYLWELEEVPVAHHLGLKLVDEIWVPTDFVRAAYERFKPGKVNLVKKALQVPDSINTCRAEFGIPEDNFAILLSFDYHSCTERKNPIAAVQGFIKAFENQADVTLVVKTTEFAPNHWGDPFLQWKAVQAIAETDQRIIIIEDYLENDQFFALINSCDAIISTHRAEGFGYLPAYAIWLEKSAIVTDYSGTADFCNADNSYLIEYDLIPTPASKFIYPMIKPVWAEVKMDSLVEQYRKCRRDSKLKRNTAAKVIKDVYSFERLSRTYVSQLVQSSVLKKI